MLHQRCEVPPEKSVEEAEEAAPMSSGRCDEGADSEMGTLEPTSPPDMDLQAGMLSDPWDGRASDGLAAGHGG